MRAQRERERQQQKWSAMEDNSDVDFSDLLLQQQLEEQQQYYMQQQLLEHQQKQQAVQQPIHPAPIPYPGPPPLSSPSYATATSAQQRQNSVRRRLTVGTNNLNDSSTKLHYELEPSLGLEVPSTESCRSDRSDQQHRFFEQHSQRHSQIFHQSLSNIGNNNTSGSHHHHISHHHSAQTTGNSRPAHLHPQAVNVDEGLNDDSASTHTSTQSIRRQRRRSSFTPQHQLDRRNSRRSVAQENSYNSKISDSHRSHVQRASTANSANMAPNRYYISGKSVQTEWSSPTRQRRSRANLQGSKHQTVNAKPPTDNDMMRMANGTQQHHQSMSVADRDNVGKNIGGMLVLPSISIPIGDDNYNMNRFSSGSSINSSHYPHLSQLRPPNFPQRRACVQASSVFCTIGVFKWCLALQIIIILPVCLYVFDAHAQKRSAAIRLQQYNEEHENILNQMMWMDQAAKKMKHSRGSGSADSNPLDNIMEDSASSNRWESYYAKNSATEDLRDSVHKLRGQMRDMQYRIQQNSKARISEKYGDGKVRVYIHPDRPPHDEVEGMTEEIGIELFVEDTPHAVSTFLYQIERGHWTRVQMNWKTETSIVSKPGSAVTSAMGDWSQTSRLEFLEHFPIKHCEVSLVQQGQMGSLSLKINLVEVPFQEEEEVCIGRLLNARMVLPKSLGYFMASFATAHFGTTSGGKSHHQIKAQAPPPPFQDEVGAEHAPQQQLAEPVIVNAQYEDAPEIDEDNKIIEEQLREEEMRQEQEVVPPLEEPLENPEDGF